MSTTTTLRSESDLPFASFIVARGIPVAGTRLDGRRVHFEFRLDAEDMDRLRHEFLSGAVIGAQLYAHTMRSLKRLAFSVVDGGAR